MASHFYLGSYIGTGSVRDPFRALGSEQAGSSAIDLRPDSSVVTGRCLVAVPVRDDTIGNYLGDDPSRAIPAPIKRRVETALGVTLSASSIRDAIAELLMDHGRTDGTRWKPLRPERTTNRYRIYLGGLLYDVPVIAGGSSISENWNCADSAGLTCQLTWTEFQNAGWRLLANQARIDANNGDTHAARADSNLATDDHFCEVTVAAINNSASGLLFCGPLWRKDATATATYYNWEAQLFASIGANAHQLLKTVAGARTELWTDATDVVAGEVLRGDANGSTIRGLRNGTQLASVTDTAIVDNLRCGVVGAATAADDRADLDTWSAEDLAAAAGLRTLSLTGVGI